MHEEYCIRCDLAIPPENGVGLRPLPATHKVENFPKAKLGKGTFISAYMSSATNFLGGEK